MKTQEETQKEAELRETLGDGVVDAALYLDIDLENIEEAYRGHWDSDEEFAQDIAEDTGALPKDFVWPLYCINWEHAARELMMDYEEHEGYYFRML